MKHHTTRAAALLAALTLCAASAWAAMPDEDFLDYCAKGDAEDIRQALKDGANPNAKTDYGYTALQSASSYRSEGAAEKIKVLLDAGADVSLQDRYGRTALMDAAWSKNGAAAVKVLLSAGAELNVRDQDGLTALSGAAKWGHVEAARVLLEAGADASVKDDEGHDALWHAHHPDENVTKKEQAAIVRLLQGGAKKPAAQPTAAMPDAEFARLCYEGTAEQVKQALKEGANPNAVDEQGFPALGNAIANKNPGTVEALLAAGAEVNVVAIGGVTPLMMAADRDVGLVRALLAAGAEVNVTASPVSRMISPLMLAAGSGKADIVAALLAAGADKSLKDDEGHDALWHARHPDMTAGVSKADQAETVRLLLQGAANKPAAATSATKYVGSIGPYPVTLFLDLRAGGEWVGRYFYDKRPQSVFRLKAVKNEPHLGGFHEVVLHEYTARGNHTGTFTGRVVTRGEGFSGTFVNSKGQSFPFELHEAE